MREVNMTPETRNGAGESAASNVHFSRPDNLKNSNSAATLQLDFKSAQDAAGISMKESPFPDGKLHRYHAEGDSPGSKNGWYVLYGDDLLAGAFGSWKTGYKGT